MLACDGSVVTAWACADSNRSPIAASRSMLGVLALPPYAPTASARNVSIVMRRTFSSSRRSNTGTPALEKYRRATTPSRTSTRTAPAPAMTARRRELRGGSGREAGVAGPVLRTAAIGFFLFMRQASAPT
jgi:hypothetical protein